MSLDCTAINLQSHLDEIRGCVARPSHLLWRFNLNSKLVLPRDARIVDSRLEGDENSERFISGSGCGSCGDGSDMHDDTTNCNVNNSNNDSNFEENSNSIEDDFDTNEITASTNDLSSFERYMRANLTHLIGLEQPMRLVYSSEVLSHSYLRLKYSFLFCSILKLVAFLRADKKVDQYINHFPCKLTYIPPF
jgi:hypothetical protein